MGINDTLSGTRPRIIIEWLDMDVYTSVLFSTKEEFFFFFFD